MHRWRQILVDYVVARHWQTPSHLANNVVPFFSYSYAFWAIVCGVSSSATGFKLLIILGCFANLAGSVVWFFFGHNVLLLVFTELLVGAYLSTLAMFQSYTLAMVARDRHAQVTGYVRASFLLGTVVSALLGQSLISFGAAGSNPPYAVLFYISMASGAIAFVGFVFEFFEKKKLN